MHGFASAQVCQQRAQYRHAVNAAVFVEAPVFDGDEGLPHVGWQVGEVNALPIIGTTHAEHLAIAIEEHD